MLLRRTLPAGGRWLTAALAGAALAWGGAARGAEGSGGAATETPQAPLQLGGGTRSVGASAPEAAADDDASPEETRRADEESLPETPAPEPPPTHKKGRAPRTPEASLPPEVPLPTPDARARAAVAAGPSSDAGPSDPELQVLRDAERVLFPQRVRGLQPGWSWDLPEADQRRERAAQLGLPLVPEAPEADLAPVAADAEWLRKLTLPDLPIKLDRAVVTYLEFYRDSQRGRTIAAIWAKKSGRYVTAMKAELERAGLPKDLVWLSLIESGHNPVIQSPAGAVGLWQFMPHSGRMYGLTVDRWVDERRDPARATQAAARFLSDLYRRFGNWELAMGAYNMGYAGMSRSVEKYNSNDFWTLSRLEGGLPWETSLYVPKIFALAIVMNNREMFGLSRIQPDSPISFDTILVEPATPLEQVAQAAGVGLEELEALNAQYLAHRTPPAEAGGKKRRWPVKVPRGVGEKAAAHLAKTKTAAPKGYRVRFGDTLEDIANALGTDVAALTALNGLEKKEQLEAGTVLLAPAAHRKPARAEQVVAVAHDVRPGPKTRRVFYRVRGDESLDEIARAFGVTTRDLAACNAVHAEARLTGGMWLQVLVPEDRALQEVRYITDADARVLVAGSREFHEYHESLKGKQRVEVVVQRGDTLWTIGRRYGMSVGSMERVNRRSRSSKLVPGETLVVYTEQSVESAASGDGPEPLPELVAPHPEALPVLSASAQR